MTLSTISDDYRRQQQELHRNPDYGVASLGFAPMVYDIIVARKIRSISDYGAGKCNLLKALREQHGLQPEYFPYDPAFPEYGPPRPADLVCCIDVLEHIEPDFLPTVLSELRSITVNCGFFSIHSDPAVKHLPDGRNAHLIQQPSSWWLPKLCEHFEIRNLETVAGGFWVFCEPRATGGPPVPA
jgi:hypothetical protein